MSEDINELQETHETVYTLKSFTISEAGLDILKQAVRTKNIELVTGFLQCIIDTAESEDPNSSRVWNLDQLKGVSLVSPIKRISELEAQLSHQEALLCRLRASNV